MKKIILLPLLFMLIVILSIFLILFPRIQHFINGSSSNRSLVTVNFHSLIPKDSFVAENISKVSPDGKYTAYVTESNLGLKDSTLWVADQFGNITKVDYQTGPYTFYSAISWNKESTKFAYLKIYPTEIIVVDMTNDFYRTKILVNDNNDIKSHLNPSIGYLGQGFLKWNESNALEFEDNVSIPASIYSVDYLTQQVNFVRDIDKYTSTYQDSITGTEVYNSFFSQRDPQWSNKRLGECSNQTIGSAGCAIASIAMAFNNIGAKEVSPDKLNLFLNSNQGYSNSCEVNWYQSVNYSKGIEFKGVYLESFKRLDYELSIGDQVILGFDKVPYTNVPHWVVARKKENNKYYISDPWGYTLDKYRTLDDLGGRFDHMIVYKAVN